MTEEERQFCEAWLKLDTETQERLLWDHIKKQLTIH